MMTSQNSASKTATRPVIHLRPIIRLTPVVQPEQPCTCRMVYGPAAWRGPHLHIPLDVVSA